MASGEVSFEDHTSPYTEFEVFRGKFDDFDFIGDSHMVRLITFLGRHTSTYCYPKKIGAAECGATISDTLRNVTRLERFSKKVVVCVGTNDILKMASAKMNSICRQRWAKDVSSKLKRLLNILRKKTDHIIWLMVPPIPRLAGGERYTFGDQHINSVINGFGNVYNKRVQTVNIQRIFSRAGRKQISFYEKTMGVGARQRPDLIHLNKAGMYKVSAEINHVAEMYCRSSDPLQLVSAAK